MTAIEAVTVDYYNTLVREERGQLRGRRLEAWAGLLEDAGFELERMRLEAVFDDAMEQFRFAEAAEHCLEKLGFDVPSDVRVALVDAFGRAGEEAVFHLADGVEDSLRVLERTGIKLGIICDVGFTASALLRDHLSRHDVLPLFDHWSFSDEVGTYKPDPAIFQHALKGLGNPPPGRVAHVGDLRRTDVAGAKALGMVSVRYTGIHDDNSQPEPEADHVIAHHSHLAGVLGLA